MQLESGRFVTAVRVDALHQCSTFGRQRPLQHVLVVAGAAGDGGDAGLDRGAPVDARG